MGCSRSQFEEQPQGQSPESGPVTRNVSEREVVKEQLLGKFRATRLKDVAVSSLPQLIVGRVGEAFTDMKSPLGSELCVAYRVEIQTQSPHDPNQWEQRYSEVKCANFFLVDPDTQTDRLYICGSEYLVELAPNSDEQPYTPLQDLSPQMKLIYQKIRLPETSIVRGKETLLRLNSQIVVFGIVELGSGPQGGKVQRLIPSTEQSLSEAFRKENDWNPSDEKKWSHFHSSNPSRLILSEATQLFQGLSIQSIPVKVPPTESNSSNSQSSPSPPAPVSVLNTHSAPPKSSKTPPQHKHPRQQPGHPTSTSPASNSSPPVLPKPQPQPSHQVVHVQVPAGAVPGSSVRVPGPDGSSMMIDIPLGALPGDVVEVVVK